jgi:2'-5' RNA ligase
MVRLFIAVPVPRNIQELITELITELKSVRGLPKDIRFAPPENWHFTLTFLGHQDESVVTPIKELVKLNFTSIVEFEKLAYGPPGERARMLWLTTSRKTSEQLGKIKKELEGELETKGVKWRRENRPYRAHLTLARFEPKPKNTLPEIEKGLGWKYETDKIHLMKSTLKRTGAEYEVL